MVPSAGGLPSVCSAYLTVFLVSRSREKVRVCTSIVNIPHCRLISCLLGQGVQQRLTAPFHIAVMDWERLLDRSGSGIDGLFFTNQTVFVLQLQDEPVQVLLGFL